MSGPPSRPGAATPPRPAGRRRATPSSHGTAPRRSLAAWRLAFRALRMVTWVRVALWRWPYARVRVRLEQRRNRARPLAPHMEGGCDLARDAATLAWAVRAAARRVPRASCLTQALALDALLAMAGHRGEVRLGVARRSDGSFEAHAWVEHEGRVLIGGLRDLGRFSVLPDDAEPPDSGTR